jgi:hypothetical protein
VRANYYGELDELGGPLHDRARAAFENCQTRSKKLGYEDDFSKSCDSWLDHNKKP